MGEKIAVSKGRVIIGRSCCPVANAFFLVVVVVGVLLLILFIYRKRAESREQGRLRW